MTRPQRVVRATIMLLPFTLIPACTAPPDTTTRAPSASLTIPSVPPPPPIVFDPEILPADLLFDYNSHTLRQGAEEELQTLSSRIRQTFGMRQPVTVTVRGYADGIGNPSYNMDLSGRRAESVALRLKDLLTAEGGGTPTFQAVACGQGGSVKNPQDQGAPPIAAHPGVPDPLRRVVAVSAITTDWTESDPSQMEVQKKC